MCNHYRNNAREIESWAVWSGYALEQDQKLQFDQWPKGQAPVARMEDGVIIADEMRWGFERVMPGKRPGTTVKKNVTNVRNLTSPFWKSMIAKPAQRCLVPFSEFAEPRPGKDPETGRPAEWWFTINDQAISAFAGIWRLTEHGKTFAFLTTDPNPLVAPLHPKAMPVILHPDDYEKWLTVPTYEDACTMVASFPSQLMSVR